MILFDSDFDGGPFGETDTSPIDGPGFHMDPVYLLGGAVIIGIIVGVIAAVLYLAKNRAEFRIRTDCAISSKSIYDCVKYHLDRALRAPGSSILDRGREVADVLEARLGSVLALDTRVGKPLGELSKALKGEKPKPKPDGPAKVKVARSTDEHSLEVWKALQALNTFWSNKAAIIALLEAAQRELVTMPAKELKHAPLPAAAAAARAKAERERGERKKTKKPRPIKVAQPIVMPKTEPDEPPPPTPAPPPTRGKKKRKDLPAHKRNMLA